MTESEFKAQVDADIRRLMAQPDPVGRVSILTDRCWHCGGTGWQDSSSATCRCWMCHGSGQLEYEVRE